MLAGLSQTSSPSISVTPSLFPQVSDNLEALTEQLLAQGTPDAIWQVISTVVTTQINSGHLFHSLARLLWAAARGNREALDWLIIAHSQGILNRPVQLLRTIQDYWQSLTVFQGSHTLDVALLSEQLARIVRTGRQLPRHEAVKNNTKDKQIKQTRRQYRDIWKAYIDRTVDGSVLKNIEKLKAKAFEQHMLLLIWAIEHPTENMDSLEALLPTFVPNVVVLNSLPPCLIQQVYQSLLNQIAAHLTTLASQQQWPVFLALYQNLLTLLGQLSSQETLGAQMQFFFGQLNSVNVFPLVCAFSQQIITAEAAALLLNLLDLVRCDLHPCENCKRVFYQTYQVSCKEDHFYYLCSECCQRQLSAFCCHEGCSEEVEASEDAFIKMSAKKKTKPPEGASPQAPEVLIIQSQVLLSIGFHQTVALMLQQAMALEGIHWQNPEYHTSVTAWLNDEFSHDAELLREIIDILSKTSGMEWINQPDQ